MTTDVREERHGAAGAAVERLLAPDPRAKPELREVRPALAGATKDIVRAADGGLNLLIGVCGGVQTTRFVVLQQTKRFSDRIQYCTGTGEVDCGRIE